MGQIVASIDDFMVFHLHALIQRYGHANNRYDSIIQDAPICSNQEGYYWPYFLELADLFDQLE